MDLNERAKGTLFEFDIELEAKKEKISEKYQLRKNHNQNKIMEKRKKRILLLNQNRSLNTINGLDGINNNQNSNKKILLNKSDISINLPLNKITNNSIYIIINYLSSSDLEKNKWAIHSLRIYFEKNNPELNEYLMLFENKIHLYLESLLKKYEQTIYIVNEILFIIANLFSRDEIINKYKEDYFSYFLNDTFLYIYDNCFVKYGEEELIISSFTIFNNILQNKDALIQKIFKKKELIHSILKIFNNKKMVNLDVVDNFIKVFRVIINGLKNGYIENKKLFFVVLDRIYFLYRFCDKQNPEIINKIIILIINAFKCKMKDEYEMENYLMMDYIFMERLELNNVETNIRFIDYFCGSLYHNINFYLFNYETFMSSLDFLEIVTDNCTNDQMQVLFKCQYYNILEILNNYYIFRIKIIPNSTDIAKEMLYIQKLLSICNNIIDVGLYFALEIAFSKFFENLVLYFGKNLMNRIILEYFLNTFIRLLGYYNIKIARNLFKRGIINEGIFSSLLGGLNENNCHFNEDTIKKMFKIISDYLQTIIDIQQNDKLTNGELAFYYKFKQFVNNTDIIPEETKECVLHLEFQNMI